jgi:pyruvate/2-oxoglutarate/acetoin dehydrogenase E1 component/TPP-dependent pyruvate/acetoin dehydrogenase alpha subunit
MAYAPPEHSDLSGLHLSDRHTPIGLSGDDVLAMWRTILVTRRLDQKIWALNRMGKAPFAVSCQGHEGAQVGSAWALRTGIDFVCPYYRDTGLMVALGMTPREILEGVFARATDPCSGGRQMPNHWGSSRLRVITGSSPIATQIPHAAGIALAARMRGEDTAVVTYFGDGAASKGDFHEAMNFVGIHGLPLVAICENNGYAISVPLAKESAVENIAEHAHVYRFFGVIVDGNDPLDVYTAVDAALRRARRGEGPTLIECKTYRYLSHTSDDDDRTYRTPQEIEAWRKKDPLQRLKQYLIEQRLLSEAQEAEFESEVTAEIEEAVRAAEAAPAPEPGDAFTKVFAMPLRPIAGVPAEFASTQAGIAPARPAVPAPGVGEDAPERTMIEAVRESIRYAMAADERVFVLGEDVGARGGVFKATDGLITEFGEPRVLDTPLAESMIVGVAIGAALHGLRPIAEIQFADFIHPAFDQIVSEAARIHYRSNGDFTVPLVIRAPYGGGVHGALYHSQSVESLFAHVPGLKVVCPSTPADVKGLLLEALDDPDPVLFLEHKKTYRSVRGPLPEGDWRVPIGVAEVVRPGTDATIVTYGIQRHLAVEAAERLAGEGAGEVEVVDLRTISPLDREAVLASARKTGRVLVVSEDNISFSVAAEVAALVAEQAFYDLDAPVMRLATADVPAMPYAPPMEAAVLITTDRIAEATRRLLRA